MWLRPIKAQLWPFREDGDKDKRETVFCLSTIPTTPRESEIFGRFDRIWGLGFFRCRRTAWYSDSMTPPPGLYSGSSTLALVTIYLFSLWFLHLYPSLTRLRLVESAVFESVFVFFFVRIRWLVLPLSGWVSSTATSSSRPWRYFSLSL